MNIQWETSKTVATQTIGYVNGKAHFKITGKLYGFELESLVDRGRPIQTFKKLGWAKVEASGLTEALV